MQARIFCSEISQFAYHNIFITCREWIHGHRFTYPPSEFYAIFADDVGTGSHILDHPEVVQLFKDIKEVGPNQAILGNMGIFYNQKGPIPFANQ